MGKNNKAPKSPDPKDTSAASTGTAVSTAIANAFLQNPDQTTPYGSVTTTLDDANGYQFTDPYTGQTYNIPKATISQTLTPEGQVIQDNNVATQTNLSQLASDQSGFLNDYMSTPFAYNPGEHEQWALDLYGNINNGEVDRQREQLRTSLVNQGVGMGTEAYDREMGRFDQSQMNSRNQFLLDSYGQGIQTALTERNQPLNEIIGLMGGSQVQQPNFINANVSGIPTTDNASIINNAYNQDLASWRQNQAAGGSALSALGGLFQTGLTLSDARAKDDKKKIGETKDGLGIYSYRYKGSPKTEIGLMAQEVKRKKPDAVKDTPFGLMAVDYERALA